jgi:DNA repair exonuclease SbcCD ATPase subunit
MKRPIPLFGARKFATGLLGEIDTLVRERDSALDKLQELGGLTVIQLEQRKESIEREVAEATAKLHALNQQLTNAKSQIVATEDIALLQEAGIYSYFHPLADAVAYQDRLETLQEKIKVMNKKDGGAIEASTSWTVNGSAAEGRAMVRDFSKLMLRAFNAEADSLVRQLKPYKVNAAIERLQKVASTIEKLGKTMHIRITPGYLKTRILELQLYADFLQKQAEEKENERAERERMREEKKAQQEMEREKARLEKERQHYLNALEALVAKGDEEAANRMRAQLGDVERAIHDVDYRAANIRAGYVYVISNIGSFGESLIKIGMTRRLDPLDRIRELSDASVPFNYDVHALFFSNDAVGIETAMHNRLSDKRLNLVNLKREFFQATALEAKQHLSELAGDLLTFNDLPEALEYRQSVERRKPAAA